MSTFIPNLEANNRSPEYILQDFLKQFVEYEINKETSDVSVGKEYIKNSKQKASYKEIKKYIDKFGTDSLIALTTLAEEENVGETILLDLLFQSSYVEPTNGVGRENFIFHTRIPSEKTVNINIPGKLNGKQVPNIFKVLCDAIKDSQKLEDIKNGEGSLTFEHDGSVTLDIPQPLFWAAFVDDEKFKRKLVEKMKMSKNELNELMTGTNIK